MTIPDGVIDYYAPLHLLKGIGWTSWMLNPILVDEPKIFSTALTPKQVPELPKPLAE